MNDVPRTPERPEDLDDFYRRASALDASRPAPGTREAILAYAEQLAASRAGSAPTVRRGAALPAIRHALRSFWRPAVFGTFAAAALAGLLVAPHWLGSGAAPHEVPLAQSVSTADVAARAAPPPELPAAPESSGSAGKVGPPAPFPQSAQDGRSAALGKPHAAPRRADSSRQESMQAVGGVDAPVASRAVQAKALTPAAAAATAAAAAPAARANGEPSTDPGEAVRRAAEAGDLPRLAQSLQAANGIDSRDAAGRAALMRATRAGQLQAVNLLLVHGADPNIADAGGTTPLQAARDAGQTAIAAALQRHGAR